MLHRLFGLFSIAVACNGGAGSDDQEVGGVGGSSSGSGGSSGGGSGGSAGIPSGPECESAEDCRLQADCCACVALAAGETPLPCGIECFQSVCDQHEISEADVVCVAGRCVMDFSCDESEVTCAIEPPACEPGWSSLIKDSCYGPCTPLEDCRGVAACDDCDAAGLPCVTLDARPSYHCVTVPEGCGDSTSCACMHVCSSPFQCAGDDRLECTCPVCG